MAKLDWTALMPSQYLRLVNSTVVGPEVTTKKRVQRLRDSYGMRIQDELSRIDLTKVLAVRWEQLKKVYGKPKFDKRKWELHRDREKRERENDIGEIPECSDPDLRARCEASLWEYAWTVHPDVFTQENERGELEPLEHCEDHETLCQDLQEVIEEGGQRAKAYQRGFGKTAWCKIAIEWGIVTGRIKFSFLVSKSEGESNKIRAGMLRRLQTNTRLRELFPEVGWVMWKLSKNPRRTFTYKGEVLKVQKIDDQFVLPVVAGSKASEAVIGCSGIFGGFRGAHYDRSDGPTVRPDCVLVDDPQDDVMAANPETVAKVIKTLQGAVEELSGPGRRMALFIPCTIIREGDVASQLTDRVLNPVYMGVRQPAMDSMPTCLDPDNPLGLKQHWSTYRQLRNEDLVSGDKNHKRATQYYVDNHEEMNEGASIRWHARYERPCIDALQWLMNKFLDKPESFAAEFMQDPMDKSAGANYPNEEQIAHLFNNLGRFQVPPDVTKITAAIDIQEHVLYWISVGWADDMTGYILGWGTTPDQPPGRFAHQTVQRKIGDWIRIRDPENAYSWEEEREAALVYCIEQLLEPIDTTDGRTLVASCVFLDARWEKIEDTCCRVAARPEFSGTVVPSGGQFVGPNRKSMSRQKLKKGESRADKNCEWIMEVVPVDVTGNNDKFVWIKQVEFDANHYRTQVMKGLSKAMRRPNENPDSPDYKPRPGRITFAGSKPDKFLASHLSAKKVSLEPGNRRTCEVWKEKPNRDQDHWLDGLVMCRIGAEWEGIRVAAAPAPPVGSKRRGRKQIKQSDIPLR